MKWVKWNEAVPEESKTSDGYVLATHPVYHNNTIKVGVAPILWSDKYGWNSKDDNGEMAIKNDGSYVTAWMYYPEPYEE